MSIDDRVGSQQNQPEGGRVSSQQNQPESQSGLLSQINVNGITYFLAKCQGVADGDGRAGRNPHLVYRNPGLEPGSTCLCIECFRQTLSNFGSSEEGIKELIKETYENKGIKYILIPDGEVRLCADIHPVGGRILEKYACRRLLCKIIRAVTWLS